MQFLQAQSQIQGSVRRSTGKPVAFADVTLVNPFDSVEVMEIMSNENGEYIFNNPPIGNYTIRATATGFGRTLSPMYAVVSSHDDILAPDLILHPVDQRLSEFVVRGRKAFLRSEIDRIFLCEQRFK